MAFKDSTTAKYVKNIKTSPRSLIANRKLLGTAALFAMAGIPLCASKMNPQVTKIRKCFIANL